jgi:Zn-dependent peptidase ImmA (M78 family)
LAKKSILKRGFKANAERLATKFRENLNIHPCAPLCALKLAKHLTIPIYSAIDFITSPEELDILSSKNGHDCEWSALTMTTKVGNQIIIYNPFHSSARQQSDLMHELAHIICNHKISNTQFDFDIPFGMRYFDEEQEEEAKYLGSALQLASPCLLWARKKNMSYDDIASYYTASKDMVIFRMNVTGIARR